MVARGCHVSSRGTFTSGPGAHYRQARGVGFPGIGRLPCSHVGARRRCPLRTRQPGPAHHACQSEMPPPPPLPVLPSAGSAHPPGGWGQELGTEDGGGGVGSPCVPSPCCVTLESFPALSGRGCHKWKCEANQTRCDYF